MTNQGLRIRLRIDYRQFDVERAIVHAPITFNDPHPVTEPGTAIKTVCVDHERVALPVTDVPSHEARFRRFCRKFSSICPDRAPSVSQLKELQHSIGQRYKLESVVVLK